MKYILHKRFKQKSMSGEVNFPAFSEFEEFKGIIFHDNSPICAKTSENAHQFFARNDDNRGILRGKLTQAIQKNLAKKDNEHQERWDLVWKDEICAKYQRYKGESYWLWSHEFFEAEISDLQHIAKLLNIKIGGKNV